MNLSHPKHSGRAMSPQPPGKMEWQSPARCPHQLPHIPTARQGGCHTHQPLRPQSSCRAARGWFNPSSVLTS